MCVNKLKGAPNEDAGNNEVESEQGGLGQLKALVHDEELYMKMRSKWWIHMTHCWMKWLPSGACGLVETFNLIRYRTTKKEEANHTKVRQRRRQRWWLQPQGFGNAPQPPLALFCRTSRHTRYRPYRGRGLLHGLVPIIGPVRWS
jgi:hypothetical protein